MVADAVGLAGYWDTPYRGQQLAVVLALLILLGLPAAVTLRRRMLARRVGPTPARGRVAGRRARRCSRSAEGRG